MAHTISATTPGIFYRKPSPDAEPYVADDGTVAEGDVIGLIEVMKTFREIKADAGGTIARWHVENEDEVSIGQEIVELDT